MVMSPVAFRHDDRPVADMTRIGHELAVESVIATMRADPSFPHTTESLAEIANYSPFHFTRMFRRVAGTPPGEFLAALRFDLAKQLILTTPASITDICFDVGFSSLGTFSSRFKQLVGVGPADLRSMPEPLHRRLPLLDNCRKRTSTGNGSSVFGTVTAPFPCDGHLFVGFFPTAISQSMPVSGTLMCGPGPLAIHDVPPGIYRAMAALFPRGDDPMAHLLGGTVLQGMDPRPVIVEEGGAARELAIQLRAPSKLDAPILTALAPMVLDIAA